VFILRRHVSSDESRSGHAGSNDLAEIKASALAGDLASALAVIFFINKYMCIEGEHIRNDAVSVIGKCWCAASDIVSDYNDNSAKNRKFCMKFVYLIFREII